MDQDPDPAFAVLFISDVENARMESDRVPEMMKNIEASLKEVDPRYHIVEKFMVGNSDVAFINENLSYLVRQGFRFIRVPKRRRICHCGELVQYSTNRILPHQRAFDVADRSILRLILGKALENSLPANILLASADSDFSLPLKILKRHMYTVMLAAGVRARNDLAYEVMHVWRWDRMYTERGGPRFSNNVHLRWQALLRNLL